MKPVNSQTNTTGQVTVLEIWETKKGYAFRIVEPGEFLQTAGPLVTESTVRVSQETLRSLCNKTESLARTPTAGVEDFKACGRALYDQLIGSLDEGLRTKITSLDTPLLISIRESDIVWELLHDGEQFWGSRYPLGRQVRAGIQPPVLPAKAAPRRCLVVANPSAEEGLKVLEEQAQLLIRHLRDLGVECRYLARHQATPEEVLMELSSGACDIFHFTGHAARINETGNCVGKDEPGDCALQLAGGWLRSFEIERAAQGISLVFLNGCQSASSVESLSNAFLRKGATLVIGTVFKVSAFGAQVFAGEFYKHALGGAMVGEAFKAARIYTQKKPNCDNAWACFVMYGNPCLKIIGTTLPSALQKPYEDSCRKVIENCVRYSQGSGLVCSPFLFAAMIDGEEPALRDGLREQGISTEKLRQLFESAREEGRNEKGLGAELEVSESVLEIINRAEEETKKNGRQRLSERDLLMGFARQGGGIIGKLLNSSGIDLMKIAGESIGEGLDQWVSYRKEKFTEEGWKVIEQTVSIAGGCNSHVAGSVHMFFAFLRNPPEELSQFLEMQHISKTRLRQALEESIGIDGTSRDVTIKVHPSATLQGIMQTALMIAEKENRKVTPSDLLFGFVQHGGGKIGELFRNQLGLELSVMFSGMLPGEIVFNEEKLDSAARKVFQAASKYAKQMGWNNLTTPHFFIGLCSLEDGLTAYLIRRQGFNPKYIIKSIQKRFTIAAPQGKGMVEHDLLPMSVRLQSILTVAGTLAKEEEGSDRITEKHLLKAFLQVGGGETAKFLQTIGLDLNDLDCYSQTAEKDWLNEREGTPLLNKLGRDLTAEARAGKLRPVIGREREIKRLQTILLRPIKNTPLLIGKAGVGKTAVVEGLAQWVVNGTVAAQLRDIRFIELPIRSLVAGTTYRGEFEARMEKVVKEATQKGIILFIDELHTIVGAGSAGSGSLDAANILKPFLARGEIKCIGATTLDEYQKLIEPDTALARRFQIVNIEEPSPEEAIAFLEGLRGDYEDRMETKITGEAVEAAVYLAVRYLPERCLPDKAIDLLEEACALAQLHAGGEVVTVSVQEVREALCQVVPGLRIGIIEEQEQEFLLELENVLEKQMVGRKEAVSAVARALRVARTNLRDPNRPVAVLLFAGPSGVGKTHLANVLAEALFGSDDAMLRLDMTEFAERHSISKLLGAPPGYVGYHEESRLGLLRRQPRTLVLLDEADKACPEVLNVFLQLFDMGRINDAQGRLIDARQALFVITANCGIGIVASSKPGFRSEETSGPDNFERKALERIKQSFPAEFLNRIDETITFTPLPEEDLREIAYRRLSGLFEQVEREEGFRVDADTSVLEYLVEKCDKSQGARDLLKKIEVEIKSPLSLQIINNRTTGMLKITASGDGIKIYEGSN